MTEVREEKSDDHQGFLGRVKHSILDEPVYAQTARERRRSVFDHLIVHVHPRLVPAGTLGLNLTWGLGGKPKGGSDWPMYGGCPARCGTDVKIDLPIKEAWKFDTGGPVYSSAAISDGLVFVGSESDKLFALDLETGKKKWEFKAGGNVHCSPAVGNGLVVFGSDDGNVVCLGRTTGKKIWKFTTGDAPSSPVIAGNRVVVSSGGVLFLLDIANGRKVWSVRVSDWITSPAVASGMVLVGADDGTVTAFGRK